MQSSWLSSESIALPQVIPDAAPLQSWPSARVCAPGCGWAPLGAHWWSASVSVPSAVGSLRTLVVQFGVDHDGAAKMSQAPQSS